MKETWPASPLPPRVAALALTLALGACAATESVPSLASGRIVRDFETYSIHRVGLMPPVGVGIEGDQAADLQAAFFAEFSAATHYQIIPLSRPDLEAIPSMEPYHRGRYSSQTLQAVSKRFELDALFIPTVTDLQTYPPQRLAVQVDLVSTETGQTLWEASVQLDAAQETVRASVGVWAARHLGDLSEDTWEVTLISPRRFARFAAYQIASLI